ncbi:MAG: M6 family metalloprotease domain-containing protein [Muribaculaceae bacterium]|nr:M6 family metalloprotease domain-containing protein [Muribaculaceae bacterium]
MKFNNIRRRLMTMAAPLILTGSAMSMPPAPGFVRIPQPDGTTVEARIIGNKDFHYYELHDGSLMVADISDGFLKPASREKVDQLRKAHLEKVEAQEAAIATRAVSPGAIRRDFPTTGTVKGLIVLAEFQDVKFQPGSTPEYFKTKLNKEGYSAEETIGSARDYFKEQSYGLFTPEFDVVGPVTLPKTCSEYGYSEDLDNLFRDAAILADTECDVNFADYDIDDDHYVDFFFVIFAGHGEAQGGPVETVWPAMKDMSYFITDRFDGKYIGVAACSCELKEGEGTKLDGVGTVCHEFSHILGLPDIYDAQGTMGYGMGHYDMMCYGPYNGEMRVPSGYTAMDKYTLGWITPRVLDGPEKDVELHDLVSTNECIFIVNPNNNNEYYTLENRQLKGFDSALPGHGLVISYVNYNRTAWKKNTVNALLSGYEHCTIVAADNKKVLNTGSQNFESGDPFPGTSGVTSFTDSTIPASIWQATGTPLPVGMAITNIREDEDGTIRFDFMADSGVEELFEDSCEDGKEYYNLQGIRVEKGSVKNGLYIERTTDGKSRKVFLK